MSESGTNFSSILVFLARIASVEFHCLLFYSTYFNGLGMASLCLYCAFCGSRIVTERERGRERERERDCSTYGTLNICYFLILQVDEGISKCCPAGCL